MQNLILKVLVGSRAHGLHNEDSDYDYRGVFVLPTEEILSLKNVGGKYKANDWFEGKEDQTTYEIGHFLKLATKCNPSILECFKAPVVYYEDLNYHRKFQEELLGLFPHLWNPEDVFNAFVGYSKNQKKKMSDKKDNRAPKYACAYLRTLYNLEQLLLTGTFTLDVTHNPEFYKRLKEIRKGNFTEGEVIDEANKYIERCIVYRNQCKHKPDLKKVNDFLIKIRKEFLK